MKPWPSPCPGCVAALYRSTPRSSCGPLRRHRTLSTKSESDRPLVCGVDRNDEAARNLSITLHQNRFDVRLDRHQLGKPRGDFVPGVERKQRFGRTDRARVESYHLFLERVVEEKYETDRDLQRIPRRIVDRERRDLTIASGDRTILPLGSAFGLKDDVTRPARAQNSSSGKFDQMAMFGRDAASSSSRSARPAADASSTSPAAYRRSPRRSSSYVHAGLRIRNVIGDSATISSARTSRISGARSRIARSTASLSVVAEAGQPSQLPSRAT